MYVLLFCPGLSSKRLSISIEDEPGVKKNKKKTVEECFYLSGQLVEVSLLYIHDKTSMQQETTLVPPQQRRRGVNSGLSQQVNYLANQSPSWVPARPPYNSVQGYIGCIERSECRFKSGQLSVNVQISEDTPSIDRDIEMYEDDSIGASALSTTFTHSGNRSRT